MSPMWFASNSYSNFLKLCAKRDRIKLKKNKLRWIRQKENYAVVKQIHWKGSLDVLRTTIKYGRCTVTIRKLPKSKHGSSKFPIKNNKNI